MSRAPFVELPSLLVFSPLGLALLDDFTGRVFNKRNAQGTILPPSDDFTLGAPIGFLRPRLEVQDDAGNWSDTKIRGLFTDSGILAYPNLGRRGKLPAHENPRNYRVRFATQYYRPFNPDLWTTPNHGSPVSDVLPPDDWFPFKVAPFTGDSDPKDLKATRGTLRLLPAPNYPFLGFIGILRGVVQGKPPGIRSPARWRASSPLTTRRCQQRQRAAPSPTPIPGARPAPTGSPCAGEPDQRLSRRRSGRRIRKP